MNLEKISYQELLKHIDDLRSKGVSDNHPDMLKAKWKLREFLDGSKKKSTALVPKLKSVKTITVDQNLGCPEEAKLINKFVALGVAVGLVALLLKFKNKI